jgi:drug/metabolite transporter (DMT)-like permease
MRKQSRAGAFAWMIAAQALFAAMALGARFVGRSLPWQEVAAARMAVALVLTWGIARARGRSLAIVDRKHAWLRTVFGTVAAAGSFYVYARPALPIGDAVTVINTSPIFVACLAWPLLGERVSPRVAVAIGVAFLGIVAVAQPSFHASWGVLVVGVLSALFTAFAMSWLRKMGPGESSEAIVFHYMCFATATLALATVPVWVTPDLRSAGFLLFTGVAGGLGQLTMTRAYSLDDAARVSAIGYSGVVFARLFALPVFGEVPNAVQLAGSLLVIGAGLLLAKRASVSGSTPRPAAPRP